MGFFDIFRRGESESVIMYKPSSKEELKALVRDNNIRLSQIDISAVDDLEGLFKNSKREDFSGIENWDVGHVKKFGYMFSNCEHFNTDISKWDTHSATSMTHMFVGCRDFDRDLSHWDVSGLKGRYKASYIKNMFAFADKMNLRMENLYAEYSVKLGSEKVFSVMPFPVPKTVDKMIFFGRHSSDLHNVVERTEDLSSIDVSAVTSLNNLFKNSTRKIFTGIKNWSLESVKTAKNFLYGAKNFKDDQLPDMPEVEIADNIARDTEYNQAVPKLDKAVSIEGAFSDIDNYQAENFAESLQDNLKLKYADNSFNKMDLEAFRNAVKRVSDKSNNRTLDNEYVKRYTKGLSDLSDKLDTVFNELITSFKNNIDKEEKSSSNVASASGDPLLNSFDNKLSEIEREFIKKYDPNKEYSFIALGSEKANKLHSVKFVNPCDKWKNNRVDSALCSLNKTKNYVEKDFNTYILKKSDLTEYQNQYANYFEIYKNKDLTQEFSLKNFIYMSFYDRLNDYIENNLESTNQDNKNIAEKMNYWFGGKTVSEGRLGAFSGVLSTHLNEFHQNIHLPDYDYYGGYSEKNNFKLHYDGLNLVNQIVTLYDKPSFDLSIEQRKDNIRSSVKEDLNKVLEFAHKHNLNTIYELKERLSHDSDIARFVFNESFFDVRK